MDLSAALTLSCPPPYMKGYGPGGIYDHMDNIAVCFLPLTLQAPSAAPTQSAVAAVASYSQPAVAASSRQAVAGAAAPTQSPLIAVTFAGPSQQPTGGATATGAAAATAVAPSQQPTVDATARGAATATAVAPSQQPTVDATARGAATTTAVAPSQQPTGGATARGAAAATTASPSQQPTGGDAARWGAFAAAAAACPAGAARMMRLAEEVARAAPAVASEKLGMSTAAAAAAEPSVDQVFELVHGGWVGGWVGECPLETRPLCFSWWVGAALKNSPGGCTHA